MTVPQLGFLLGLLAVVLAIVVFAGLVVVSAARNAGDPVGGPALVARLARAPKDRMATGRLAFWAHRISGVGIFAFLGLHLVDVGLYAISADLYDEVHALYGTPPMRLFESALLVAILFHALNGLRVLAMDLVDLRPRTAGRLLMVAVVVTAVIGGWGSAIILAPLFGGAP